MAYKLNSSTYKEAQVPAHNRSARTSINRVLRSIWLNEGTSRVDLARSLGFDKSSITHSVNRLLELGLVVEPGGLDQGAPGGGASSGRRPSALHIAGNAGYSLGVEVLPNLLRAAIVNLDGELVDSRETSIDAHGFRSDLDTYRRILEPEVNFWGGRYPLCGIGLALSGVVDTRAGILKESSLLRCTFPLELTASLSGLFSLPVFAENDANACVWGELTVHRKEAEQDFIFLLLESDYFRHAVMDLPRISLGMGLSIQGRLHAGTRFTAGEFRSLRWTPSSDSQFSFPNRELENLGSDSALRKRLFDEIGENLALLVNGLNITRIIVGGDVDEYSDELREALLGGINHNWSYSGPVDCSIQPASHGRMAAAYGAAAVHVQRVFSVETMRYFEDRQLTTGPDVLDRK